MALKRTTHQAPATAAATGCGGKLGAQLVGAHQRAQPKQAAEAAAVEHQVHRQLQLVHELRQSLQGEQVGAVVFRVAALTEPIQLALLTGAQAFGPAAEMRLSQWFSSQAPADRRPRDRPGRRVR